MASKIKSTTTKSDKAFAGQAPQTSAFFLPVARIYEGHINAVRLVIDHGTPEQCRCFADQVSDGAIAGVWGAEGSHPVTINDSALTGVKTFASGLGDVAIAVLTAKTPNGLQMILADVTDPTRFDHGVWDMLAMVGSRSGQFDCTGLSAQCDQQPGVPDAHSWHRLGLAAMEAATARSLAHAACLAVETEGAAPAAIGTVLFAREAVEQAATRQFELIERAMGTAIHRTHSVDGRIMRNLRLYFRQAQLDGKLALATRIWATQPVDAPWPNVFSDL